jgi:hypothetical protein
VHDVPIPATQYLKGELMISKDAWHDACYDMTLIFLEYEIVAMGRRSMNVDVAVMREYRSYLRYLRYSL